MKKWSKNSTPSFETENKVPSCELAEIQKQAAELKQIAAEAVASLNAMDNITLQGNTYTSGSISSASSSGYYAPYVSTTSTTPQWASGGVFVYNNDPPPPCAHDLEQIGFSNRYRCGKCELVVTIKLNVTLATCVREFYKKILDAPLTAQMLHEWEELSATMKDVLAAAVKYGPLIEEEITTKIGG